MLFDMLYSSSDFNFIYLVYLMNKSNLIIFLLNANLFKCKYKLKNFKLTVFFYRHLKLIFDFTFYNSFLIIN